MRVGCRRLSVLAAVTAALPRIALGNANPIGALAVAPGAVW